MKKYLIYFIFLTNIFATDTDFINLIRSSTDNLSRKEFYSTFKDKGTYIYENSNFKLSNKTLYNDKINKLNLQNLEEREKGLIKSFYINFEGENYYLYFVRDYAENLIIFNNNKRLVDFDTEKHLGYFDKRVVGGYNLIETYGSVYKISPNEINNIMKSTGRNFSYLNQRSLYFDLDNNGTLEFINFHQAEGTYDFYKLTNNKKVLTEFDINNDEGQTYFEFVSQNKMNFILKIYKQNLFSPKDVKKVDVLYIKDKKITKLDSLLISRESYDYVLDYNYSVSTGSISKKIKKDGVDLVKKELDMILENNKNLYYYVAFSLYDLQYYPWALSYFDNVIAQNTDKYNKVSAMVYKVLIYSIIGEKEKAIEIKNSIENLEKSDPDSVMGGFPALTPEETLLYENL